MIRQDVFPEVDVYKRQATADIGGVEKDPFCTNGGADVDGQLQ